MCVCGGIIEVGIICGIIGCVGKLLNKCNCNCHKQNDCVHCNDEHEENSVKKLKKYKIIQILFHFLIFISISCLVVYVIVKHFSNHDKKCNIEHVIHK